MTPVMLFDLDGTLLDSLADIARCGNAALEKNGLPAHTLEEYKSYIGNGADMLIRRMLGPEGYDRYGAKVKSDYMAIYGDLCAQGGKVFPGVLEMLCALQKAGFLTAVISNKPEVQTRLIWESTCGERLDLAQGQIDGIPRKPDPAGPREVLRRLNGSCAAYVGDSEVDMQTGRNCGFYTVGVTWGMKPRGVLLENGADRLADTIEELTGILLEAGAAAKNG